MRLRSDMKPFAIRRSPPALFVKFGESVRVSEWTEHAGSLGPEISSLSCARLRLDFSETKWADPLPLLWLACSIADLEERNPNVSLEIDLGNARPVADNRFLVFLASQNFLASLGRTARVRYDGETYPIERQKELIGKLSQLKAALAFSNADAIHAKIFRNSSLREPALSALVEELLDESHKGRVSKWLPSTDRERGLLLQKLRVTLREALENIADHAYPPDCVGFGAIYARIRLGMPEGSEQASWRLNFQAEQRGQNSLSRRLVGRRPGWLELFVCDLGGGIAASLHKSSAPLFELTNKMFRDPLSRFENRASVSRTDVTGLQHVGFMLSALTGDRGDFVRVYCNGEWNGEHLPWPTKQQRSGYDAPTKVRGSDIVRGTAMHFCFEPATFGVAAQRQHLPKCFVVPQFEDLAIVRAALALSAENLLVEDVAFVDLFKGEHANDALRGVNLANWLSDILTKTLVIRPSRTSRKIDVKAQVEYIAATHDGGIRTLVFADLPGALAVDFSHVLQHETFRWPKKREAFRIVLVTQDWCCAVFNVPAVSKDHAPDVLQPIKAVVDLESAVDFLKDKTLGGVVAQVLKQSDTDVFWDAVSNTKVEAFLNEQVIWKSGGGEDIAPITLNGYLDLSTALADPDCADAARRALRRCISSFAIDVALGTDELAESVIDEDFERPSEVASTVRAKHVVLAGSVLMTGSTERRFMKRRDIRVLGSVGLVAHPQAPQTAPSHPPVIALDWRGSEERMITPALPYERIPNTAYIIRGGESSVPIPRFSPPQGSARGVSLYGEAPNDAYRRWQQNDLLKLGHWVYRHHHDLLTIKLHDALQHDRRSGAEMLNWVHQKLLNWKRAAEKEGRGFAVVFPRHRVSDSLVRYLRQLADPIEAFFPVHFVEGVRASPFMAAPLSREKLWRHFNESFLRGGTVALLDDGVLTGSTMEQLKQHVEGVWDIPDEHRSRTGQLEVRTVALIDRTGMPMHRDLVQRSVENNPRYWRWDVPTLGEEGSCRLCAALTRLRDLRPRLEHVDLVRRLDQWLERWEPVSIADSRPDHGVTPKRLPGGDSTRFCIEEGVDSYHVQHSISTSRASLAAEIARATTRKDYPLEKAQGGLTAAGTEIELQTRMEILATHCLLFWQEFDFQSRVERLEACLDLLWQEPDSPNVTALVGMCLLLDPTAANAVWPKICELVENEGFGNDDALIATFAIYRSATTPIPDTTRRRNWSLLRLLTQPRDSLKGALGRLFSVIGWDEGLVHRPLLADMLRTKTPSASQVGQMLMMLTALKASIEAIQTDAVVAAVHGYSPADDIALTAKHIAEIRKSLFEAAGLPKGFDDSDAAQVSLAGLSLIGDEEHSMEPVLSAAYDDLFGTTECLSRRYRHTFSRQSIGPSLAHSLLHDIKVHLKANWPKIVDQRRDAEILARWQTETPLIVFVKASDAPARPILAYRDAQVGRALMEVMINVMHAEGRMASPWNPEGKLHAHMWIRATIINDGAAIRIEFVNRGSVSADAARMRLTNYSAHLSAMGGKVSVEPEGELVRTVVQLPTLGGIVGVGERQ